MKNNYSELNRFQRRIKILLFFVSLLYLMIYVAIAFAMVARKVDAEHKPFTLKGELNTSLLPTDHLMLLTSVEPETTGALNESKYAGNMLIYPKAIRSQVEGRVN